MLQVIVWLIEVSCLYDMLIEKEIGKDTISYGRVGHMRRVRKLARFHYVYPDI